jgi:hypothetical protein
MTAFHRAVLYRLQTNLEFIAKDKWTDQELTEIGDSLTKSLKNALTYDLHRPTQRSKLSVDLNEQIALCERMLEDSGAPFMADCLADDVIKARERIRVPSRYTGLRRVRNWGREIIEAASKDHQVHAGQPSEPRDMEAWPETKEQWETTAMKAAELRLGDLKKLSEPRDDSALQSFQVTSEHAKPTNLDLAFSMAATEVYKLFQVGSKLLDELSTSEAPVPTWEDIMKRTRWTNQVNTTIENVSSRIMMLPEYTEFLRARADSPSSTSEGVAVTMDTMFAERPDVESRWSSLRNY